MKIISWSIERDVQGNTTIITEKEGPHPRIITSFTDKTCLRNIAQVYMNPSEARKYAQQLIIAANKIDTLE